MSRFDYPSRYYADDKDVSDLLSEPKFTVKTLRRISRERGIFLSADLPKETVVEYISQLPFSWPELVRLIKTIETEEKEESSAVMRHDTRATIEQLLESAKKVQALRGQMNSEIYMINAGVDSVTMIVKFQEIDHRSTRTLQWTDHTIQIQAQKTLTGYEISYADTDRGQSIVDALVDELPAPEEGEKKVHRITLEGVPDSDKKTEFFRSLIYGMTDLRPENVKDVRMNRLVADDQGQTTTQTENLSLELEEDDSDKSIAKSESPASVVKKTTLTGDSVFQSPQFHEFCKQGFFVSRAVWTAVERSGKGRKFEFEAEFKGASEGGHLSYRLRGMWDRDEDGELVLKKSAVGIADRRTMVGRLQAAAFAALEEARKEEAAVEAPVKDTV
ncbi:MAG: hypothetical protein K8R23_04985 [Chthoniobacter sp.]|nr:hypothetical protein [Chthoniobacter sp.]